jgi:trigger factor
MPAEVQQLKIQVQEEPSWSRRVTVTVPAERVKRTRSAVAQRLSGSVKLPGFRKGKIPSGMVEKRFGPAIEQETLDRTIQEAYREALEEKGLIPISQGTVENVQYEPGQDLTFDVHFEIQPEIVLENLSGFSVTRPAAVVTEEDVGAILERLRDERALWRPVEGEERPDYADQVTVDITALEAPEGPPKEGEEPKSYRFAIGEGQAIPDVEDAIRTLTPGEEQSFTVRFPDDFPDEAQRGQEQHLRIKLNDVRRKELPELDDDLAKAVGDFEDLGALRERIRTDLAEDARQRAEGEVRGELLHNIVEANPFEIPGSMVERYLDHMTGHAHADGKAREHHHSPEEEERISQVRAALRPQAEAGLKRMIAVERIAELQGLRATQDEIDAKVEELASKHELSASEVWLQLEKSGQLETMEREITEEKVFDYLKSVNTVNDR